MNMVPTYTIAEVFETPSRGSVLRVLALASSPLSMRAIGRAAGISHTAAAATLRDLEAMGLVRGSKIGRASAYALCEHNAYVRHMVLPAIEAEQVILAELRDDLTRAFAEHSESLILFGSYALGTQTQTSDIDVFALASDGRRKQRIEERAADLHIHFSESYSAPLSLLVYTRSEAVEHLLTGENPFRTELESTGIILHGLAVSEWGMDGTQEQNAGRSHQPRTQVDRKGRGVRRRRSG